MRDARTKGQLGSLRPAGLETLAPVSVDVLDEAREQARRGSLSPGMSQNKEPVEAVVETSLSPFALGFNRSIDRPREVPGSTPCAALHWRKFPVPVDPCHLADQVDALLGSAEIPPVERRLEAGIEISTPFDPELSGRLGCKYEQRGLPVGLAKHNAVVGLADRLRRDFVIGREVDISRSFPGRTAANSSEQVRDNSKRVSDSSVIKRTPFDPACDSSAWAETLEFPARAARFRAEEGSGGVFRHAVERPTDRLLNRLMADSEVWRQTEVAGPAWFFATSKATNRIRDFLKGFSVPPQAQGLAFDPTGLHGSLVFFPGAHQPFLA